MTNNDIEPTREYEVFWDRTMVQKGILQLNKLEQNTLLFLSMQIKGKDDTDLERVFDVRDYCKALNLDWDSGRNYSNVKKALWSLSKKSWWYYEESTDTDHLLNWLDRCKINKGSGIVTVRIHEDLAKHLFSLTDFIQFYGEVGLAFNSKYSLPLYTLILSYMGNRQLNYTHFDVEFLKVQMGAENWKTWGNFQRYALEKAIEDINEVSNITITGYDKIKSGRYISAIQFHVRRKGGAKDEDSVYETYPKIKDRFAHKPKKRKEKSVEAEQYKLDL